MQVDVDEATSRRSRRRRARGTSAPRHESLREIYDIDKAEKTAFEAPSYQDYRELYPWALWPALSRLVAELVLADTRLRKVP
jgi:hypothetical protein